MIELSLQELQELKKKCAVELAAAEDDHLLVKLTDYHTRLSSAVENFSTERLSPEVQTLNKFYAPICQTVLFLGVC